jgi:hypothetical protein
MRRIFGPRLVYEAALVIAVPFVAALVGVGTAGIIGAAAVGYLVVLVFEAALIRQQVPAGLRKRQKEGGPKPVARAPAERAPAEPGRGSEPEVEPVAAPTPTPAARTGIRERLALRRKPAAAPAGEARASETPEHVRVLPRAEPAPGQEPEPTPGEPVEEPAAAAPAEPPPPPEPEPEPEPARPPLVAVPAPPPEPEPLPEPEPAPAAASEPTADVVPIGASALPRQWNVWDLERLARENAGGDAVRDEERTFLLLYLREFADPSGMLPVDFDGLVRDSFGELVAAR